MVGQSIQAIQRLESAERIRVETERMKYQKRKRRLDFGKVLHGGWKTILIDEEAEKEDFEDEGMKGIRLHRESIIWYLRNSLEKASEIQRTQQEIRVMRQVEKSKSMLYKAKGAPLPSSRPGSAAGSAAGSSPTDAYSSGVQSKTAAANGGLGTGSLPAEEKESIEQILSPEQLQIFAKENQDMMKYYEDTLDQVRYGPPPLISDVSESLTPFGPNRTAEKSLIEISEMHTQLASNLASQSVFIDQLVADSITTVENLDKGNKQLKEASERSSVASSFFYGAIGFSLLVITYDFLV